VRVRYLVRLESMVNVGCKFGPNDLPADVWDQLVTLAMERAFVDRLVQKRHDRQGHENRAMGKARATTGVPPPGGTLFPTKKPFR
jgi:hypothetical protein